MKKSKIITVVGVFIITTVLLTTVGKHYTYRKKINFTSTKELLEELNSNPLATHKNESKNQYDIVYSDTFNECLSKRKRITYPGVDFCNLNIKINEDKNNEEDKNRIISQYLLFGQNIKSFKKPDKIEAYNFVGKGEDLFKRTEKIDMDIVMIDEGEGWVIDYFMINQQEDRYDSNKY